MSRGVEVLDTGPSVLVQDEGRRGHAHLGVPRAGWLDAPSARLANRLVGNAEGAAVLECLLGGVRLRARTAMSVAVTGAPCPVSAAGRPASFGAALSLAAGDELVVGSPRAGLRAYVAFAGGVVVDPVLGSRSTDTLAGVGPPAVTPGTVLPVGPPRSQPPGVEASTALMGGPAVLGVWPGPRADWFDAAALETFASATYAVHADSNRVGLRLDGPALSRSRTGELPSEGIVLGSVQVPADGRPLVFLHDHPTTGGYPVVAVVDPGALARCAQLRPGDAVSFRWLAQPPGRRAGGG